MLPHNFIEWGQRGVFGPLQKLSSNLTLAQKFYFTEILPPRLFHFRMSYAPSQKRSTKGPLITKVDHTLTVYLYLLVYATES